MLDLRQKIYRNHLHRRGKLIDAHSQSTPMSFTDKTPIPEKAQIPRSHPVAGAILGGIDRWRRLACHFGFWASGLVFRGLVKLHICVLHQWATREPRMQP